MVPHLENHNTDAPHQNNMASIITAAEVCRFMRIIDTSDSATNGQVLTPTTDTDPSSTYLDMLIDLAESDIERTTGIVLSTKTATEIHKHYKIQYNGLYYEHVIKPNHIPLMSKGDNDTIEWLRGTRYREIAENNTRWSTEDSTIHVIRPLYYSPIYRLTYQYGYTTETIPSWVKRCCLMLVGIELLRTGWGTSVIEMSDSVKNTIDSWQKSVDDMLSGSARFGVV